MELFYDFDGSGEPASEALRQAERLLACQQKALGHELPNYLVALGGLARLLEETQADRLDAEGRACLERLATLARRAGSLVAVLAEVGRLCRPARPEEGTPGVSLPEVAREAAAEVSLLGGGPIVAFDFPDDLPLLTVSHRALYQVLIHLLRNAAQAALPSRPLRIQVGGRALADRGSRIEDRGSRAFDSCGTGIPARAEAAGQECPAHRPGGTGIPARAEAAGQECPAHTRSSILDPRSSGMRGVEFWVSDNGRGLLMSRPESVFEPFAGSTAGQPAGYGLGLFLVRQLVASWGGALRVQSQPGQGTTFTVLVRNPRRPGAHHD